MVGHLKNVSPIFAQMPNRITNVEFTTVSPTIANTMLYAVLIFKRYGTLKESSYNRYVFFIISAQLFCPVKKKKLPFR